jgi:hypothetical protein
MSGENGLTQACAMGALAGGRDCVQLLPRKIISRLFSSTVAMNGEDLPLCMTPIT